VTAAAETIFISMWQQGAGQQELAAHFGVPVGTMKSRASALARQGKIQARPKGGAYPHQRHQAAMAPVQTPVQSSAVHTSLHGAETVQTSAEPQISAALAEELRRL
jgi:DNA-binding GntR family transcriptional regulator